MQQIDDAGLLEAICDTARRAGAAIMEIYGAGFEVEHKADSSPLTAADLAAHAVIVEALGALQPQWPVLSEESSEREIGRRREWSRYWLVDPLDGTKEFIKRNGEFTVNIALIDKHEPVLGAVFAPVPGRLYSGIAGAGAWVETAEEGRRAINVCVPAATPLRVVGSRSHASPALNEYLQSFGDCEVKPMGSSLKICLVAEGEADIYPRFGPTSEWDTAAAHAVLRAAGGSMIDPDGRPIRYNCKDDLLNPHFFAFGDSSRDWILRTRGS